MTPSELIARLEAATDEGSRELDAAIVYVIGDDLRLPEESKPMFRHWWDFATHEKGEDPLPWVVRYLSLAPHYTTSLDAALPWENIVEAQCLHQDGPWRAVHQIKQFHYTNGTARTEALARRIAALKAMEDK